MSNICGDHFTYFTTDAINTLVFVFVKGRKKASVTAKRIIFMVGTSTSSDFCSSHYSACLLDYFPVCLLKVTHSQSYALKEASVINTPILITLTNRKKRKCDCFKLQPSANYASTDGHKFSWFNCTYTPLSGNMFVKHGLQRSLEAVLLDLTRTQSLT